MTANPSVILFDLATDIVASQAHVRQNQNLEPYTVETLWQVTGAAHLNVSKQKLTTAKTAYVTAIATELFGASDLEDFANTAGNLDLQTLERFVAMYYTTHFTALGQPEILKEIDELAELLRPKSDYDISSDFVRKFLVMFAKVIAEMNSKDDIATVPA